jgi:hypothetical protein
LSSEIIGRSPLSVNFIAGKRVLFFPNVMSEAERIG